MNTVDTDLEPAAAAVAELRSTQTIRARAGQLLHRARSGTSPWFSVHDDAIPIAADYVATVTTRRYPDLSIPFHSRWRHFEAGDVDRLSALDDALPSSDPVNRARALIDVAVVSVLLDAGAGDRWTFREESTSLEFSRSEGLGVASWHAFTSGLFSGDPDRPLQVDAEGLAAITPDSLGAAFRVSANNPLVGLNGRVDLLRNLGAALSARPDVFGIPARPGGLYDHLTAGAGHVAVHDILRCILDTLSPIWPADNTIGAQPVGDCWQHRAVSGPGLTDGWVPFHKLSQWLTYSLLEPFTWSGMEVRGIDTLTGLPEYRNGGLLLDTAILRLRDPAAAHHDWRVGDEFIVEWRALTVALLDELADHVRRALGRTAQELPLACVLEGGTWAAGRELAAQFRNGLPPITIISDGTVF